MEGESQPEATTAALIALDTADAVFDALGGFAAVAVMTRSKYKAVVNWKSANAFPPKTYVVMIAALSERGYAAPASLWGMVAENAEAAE
jgi:hypothetical protein